MLTGALQKKWVMQLMVLIYLLLSLGTANATFWCHTDENSSRLKVNPVGKCWVNCSHSPDAEMLHQDSTILHPAGLSFTPGDDCLDSPVFTSALPSSKLSDLLNKNLESPFDATYLPHISALNLGVIQSANHTLPGYLPEPHTLQVLRTVVLLR